MPANRTFTFPVSTLIRDAKRFLAALEDPTIGPPVASRLLQPDPDPAKPPLAFPPLFDAQIQRVEKGGTDQSTAVGTGGTMTLEQARAFTELERLMAGARRSAGIAFPANDTRLHAEFQVGVHEPQDFGSELKRAALILAACRTHAAALAAHGWIAADTNALAAAIAILNLADVEHVAVMDQKKGFTQVRNLAANTLYKMCLSTQNAARLAYPSTQAAHDAAIQEARDRYLLDTFPPRTGASAGDPTPTPAPPPTPPQ